MVVFSLLSIAHVKCSQAVPGRPFVTAVFYGLKYYTILLKKVGLRVPNRDCKDFTLFNVDLKRRNCPSARRSSTANATDGDNDLFSGRSVWLASDTCSA